MAPIRIKPENRGKLRASMGAKPGQKLSAGSLAKRKKADAKSGNTADMKRVVFAQNARKWKKGGKKKNG